MYNGLAVRGSCSDHLLKDLEQIHLRAARFIYKLRRDMDDEYVLTVNAKWMPLSHFYCFRILTITHKAFYNLDLDEINGLVVKTLSSYTLMKSLNVDVSRPRTEIGHRSFTHGAAVAWSTFPDVIKQHDNPKTFQRKLTAIKNLIMDINFHKECSVTCDKDPNVRYFLTIYSSQF